MYICIYVVTYIFLSCELMCVGVSNALQHLNIDGFLLSLGYLALYPCRAVQVDFNIKKVKSSGLKLLSRYNSTLSRIV